jgi:hypothetical protein
MLGNLGQNYPQLNVHVSFLVSIFYILSHWTFRADYDMKLLN